MTDRTEEARRLTSMIATLEAGNPDPSPEKLETIKYLKRKLAALADRVKPFVPYRNEDGVMVINECGDTEDDQ